MKSITTDSVHVLSNTKTGRHWKVENEQPSELYGEFKVIIPYSLQ